MESFFKNIIRKKAINLIKESDTGVSEIMINIELSFILINLIEYDKKSDSIFLHSFEEDSFNLIFDFEDLKESDMFKILKILKFIL
jgi:hypothetical protein